MSGRATSLAILVASTATFWGLAMHGRRDIARYVEGSLPAASGAEYTSGARADTLVPLKISTVALGTPTVPNFAFDPAVVDRVVACSAVSVDGGRTWPALMADAVVRPMIFGGPRAVAPVPGPEGRFLCGDMTLPGLHVPSGPGDVHPATEWNGQAFTAQGLPAAANDYASQPVPTSRVAYGADGAVVAARGRELLWAEGGRYEAPGDIAAFAIDGRGRVVGITRRDKGTDLMAADAVGSPWTRVQAPGMVRDVVAAGDRVFVAADLLGVRDAEGAWRWLPWPANLQAERIAVAGDTVLAWGHLKLSAYAGALAISHDGGETIRFAVLDQRPLFAALDPHHPKQVLAVLEARGQRQLARLTLE